jgi:sialic acid synthase SpsE
MRSCPSAAGFFFYGAPAVAQMAALLVAEFVQKSACLSRKQQLTPAPSRGAIFDRDKPDFILKNGPWKGRRLYDLYKATEPPREWFPELLLHARKIGITIFSFVFSPEDVDFLEQFNPPAYKIASADRAFALSSKSRRAKWIT